MKNKTQKCHLIFNEEMLNLKVKQKLLEQDIERIELLKIKLNRVQNKLQNQLKEVKSKVDEKYSQSKHEQTIIEVSDESD